MLLARSRLTLAALTLLLAAASLSSSACSLIPGGSDDTPPSPSGQAPSPQPASNATETVEPAAEVKPIDGGELEDLAEDGAIVVDVRDGLDFEFEHLPEAVSVPMTDFTKKSGKWAEDDSIVVYGSRDAKAKTAAAWLVRNGFQNVYRLEGGLESWDGEREGLLADYRLDRPTAIYVYSEGCSVCEEATPEFDALAKEYGKRIDFQKWDAADMVGKVRLWSGELATETDLKNGEKFGEKVSMITAVPTFIIVEDDPRTYRKVVGVDGLRVLYAWLQEQ